MSSPTNLYELRKRPGNIIARLDPDFTPLESIYSIDAKGISVNGTHHISVKDTFEHVLLVGSTGVGKTTKIIIPSLARLEGSMVVHDPSKEILTIMEKDLLDRGFKIEVLNFSERGSGYNPLRHISEESDIHLISDLLVRAGKNIRSQDEHWISRASELIVSLIHLVIKKHGEIATLEKVRLLLIEAINDSKKVEELFEQFADEKYSLSYRALTKNKTNELSSIFSTASEALKDFTNPNIVKVTSQHDIDLSSLRKEKTALFIQNSPNRSHLYNKVISIFFEQLWLSMMENIPLSADQDLFVILDEARSLYLPTLPYKIDKARKYRMGFLITVQTLQQLRSAYGEDAYVIEDNCKTQIYLGAQKGNTAKKIEEILGRKGNRVRFPREKVRMLNSDTILILCGGLPPLLGKSVAYYDNPLLSQFSYQIDTDTDFTENKCENGYEYKEPWEDVDKEPDWEKVDFYL